eukprot:CAMPEP_0202688948 /NCGR_PEP_ID=MMETSP1385-20130828/4330_1 /ASSEMBLY_ACC=CAM_ASM_000861 /TAXON_ID=933848 /ORGANISM="Elphidium margaritaceum" /LENGTH=213 /DNA_ID=CAMNT_0049344013 /DNA_START=32 /DNA_END=673 /DNA_ORIENTATION=+
MTLWRRTVSTLLYQTHRKSGIFAYASCLRRASASTSNSVPSWMWIRTQAGYFSLTKTGKIRKTNFSGGTPLLKVNEIDNGDGTISFQVHDGKFKDFYIAVDGEEHQLGLNETSKARLEYNGDDLVLKLKDESSAVDNADLYFNRITGYFSFGFEDLDTYHDQERQRWSNPHGLDKGIANFGQKTGWQKIVAEGYERCAVRFERENLQHSSGLI